MLTNDFEQSYINSIQVIHKFLSLWPTERHIKKRVLPKLTQLKAVELPSKFDEHNDVIDLVVECINAFVYIGSYHYQTAFTRSECNRLRDASHQKHENQYLREQDITPRLDYQAACIEPLELNKLVTAAYIEEMDYAEF